MTLKTGIDAKSSVIPSEDPAELQQLADSYHDRYQPSTAEAVSVDTLVSSEWELRRLRKVEAHYSTGILAADPTALGPAFEEHQKVLARIFRRIEALERSYYRALRELQRIEAEAAQLLDSELFTPAEQPVGPAELGSFHRVLETVQEPAQPPPPGCPENLALRL